MTGVVRALCIVSMGMGSLACVGGESAADETTNLDAYVLTPTGIEVFEL